MVRETKHSDNPLKTKVLFRDTTIDELSQCFDDFIRSQKSYMVFLQPEQGDSVDLPIRGYGATTFLDSWYYKQTPHRAKPHIEYIKVIDNKDSINTGLTSLVTEIVNGFLATNRIARIDIRWGLSWFLARLVALFLILFVSIVATIIFAASVAQILSLFDYEDLFAQLAAPLENPFIIFLLVLIYILLLGLAYLAYRSTAFDNVRRLVDQFPPPWRVRARFSERIPQELGQGLLRYCKKDHRYVFIVDDLDYTSATDILTLRDIFDTLARHTPILVIISVAKSLDTALESKDWVIKSLPDTDLYEVAHVFLPLLTFEQMITVLTNNLFSDIEYDVPAFNHLCQVFFTSCSTERALPGDAVEGRVGLNGRLDLVLGFWRYLSGEQHLSIDITSLAQLSEDDWRKKFASFLGEPFREITDLMADLSKPENADDKALLRTILAIRAPTCSVATLANISGKQREDEIRPSLRRLEAKGVLVLSSSEKAVQLIPSWRVRLEREWSDWNENNIVGEHVLRYMLKNGAISLKQLAEQALIATASHDSIEVLVSHAGIDVFSGKRPLRYALRYLYGKDSAISKWLSLIERNLSNLETNLAEKLSFKPKHKLLVGNNKNIDLFELVRIVARLLFDAGCFEDLVTFINTDCSVFERLVSRDHSQDSWKLLKEELTVLRLKAQYELGQWSIVVSEYNELLSRDMLPSDSHILLLRIENSRQSGLTQPVRTSSRERAAQRLSTLLRNSSDVAQILEGYLDEISTLVEMKNSEIRQTQLRDGCILLGDIFGQRKFQYEGTVNILDDIARLLGIADVYRYLGFVLREMVTLVERQQADNQYLENALDEIRLLNSNWLGINEVLQIDMSQLDIHLQSTGAVSEGEEAVERNLVQEKSALASHCFDISKLLIVRCARISSYLGSIRLVSRSFRSLALTLYNQTQLFPVEESTENGAQIAEYLLIALQAAEQTQNKRVLPSINYFLGYVYTNLGVHYSRGAPHFFSAAKGIRDLGYSPFYIAQLYRQAAIVFHNEQVLYQEDELQNDNLIESCNSDAKYFFEQALLEPEWVEIYGELINANIRTIALELATQYLHGDKCEAALREADSAISLYNKPSTLEQRGAYGKAVTLKALSLAGLGKFPSAIENLVIALQHYEDWSEFHVLQTLRSISGIVLAVTGYHRLPLTQGDVHLLLQAGLRASVDNKRSENWHNDHNFITAAKSLPSEFDMTWVAYINTFSEKYKTLWERRKNLESEFKLELAVSAELMARIDPNVVQHYREAIELYTSLNEAKRALQVMRYNLMEYARRGVYSFAQTMEDLGTILKTEWGDPLTSKEILAEIYLLWRRLSRKKLELEFKDANRRLHHKRIKMLLTTNELAEAEKQLVLLRDEISASVLDEKQTIPTSEDLVVFDHLYALSFKAGDSRLAAQYLTEKTQLERDIMARELLELASYYSIKNVETAKYLLATAGRLNPRDEMKVKIASFAWG